MRDQIRRKMIKQYGSVNKFCKENGFIQPHIANFLNGKTELQTNNMFRILKILNVDIFNLETENIKPIQSVGVNGDFFKNGDYVTVIKKNVTAKNSIEGIMKDPIHGKYVVVGCYGNPSSAHSWILVSDLEGYELRVLEA